VAAAVVAAFHNPLAGPAGSVAKSTRLQSEAALAPALASSVVADYSAAFASTDIRAPAD